MKIIGIGDNVVDFYEDRGEMFPGGNALNVAVFCKRYGVEKSSYVGLIGNDQAGNHVLESLKAENIDVSQVRQVIGVNGEARVTLDEQGDRIFVGSNKEISIQSQLKLNFNKGIVEFIKEHDLLHTSVFSHIEKDLEDLAEIIPISFDFSTRRDEEYLKAVCPYLEFGFFSGGDLSKEECIELMKYVQKLGVKKVGLTRGSKGSLFLIEDELYEQPIVEGEVVDTLGAGDSYISMLLTKYYEHQDIQKAMQEGAVAAVQTCGDYGAFGYGVEKNDFVKK